MAYRLGEYVVHGEIYNTANYATTGMIALRGRAQDKFTMLRLELTGDCGPDLKGKRFRFWPEKEHDQGAIFDESDLPGFQLRQIGPTRTMTSQGYIRVLPCPVEEYIRRRELGEPPPTAWKRRLYLEWYGQNGRVVIEMAGVVVEEYIRDGDKGSPEWVPLPNLAFPAMLQGGQPPCGPGITMLRREDGHVEAKTWRPEAGEYGKPEVDLPSGNLYDDNAGDLTTWETAYGEASDDLYEVELMDYCIENLDGTPIASLLKGAANLPSPESLDDEQVEIQLKSLLVKMAALGLALDVCEHFTPRDCYRLLTETILPEATAFKELAGTGWVQHMPTWEYCARCEAEFEADHEHIDEPPRDEPDQEESGNIPF